MGGLAPLSHIEIQAFVDLHGIEDILPEEVEALLILDAVLLEDPDKAPDEDDQVTLPKPQLPWPEKK